MKKPWLVGLLLCSVGSLALPSLTYASHPAQLTPFPTPTPRPDGRIIYIVQPGDTLIRISLISGVPIEELRGLNKLTGDNIIVGQELLLGLGGPTIQTPTPGPSPTPTLEEPTPTPLPGIGTICVLLYEDINGDAMRQESENAIPGGAISLSERSGKASLNAESRSGSDPICFNDLPEGEYTISVAIPAGYNPTTLNTAILELRSGDEAYLDFGAQKNSEALADGFTETGSPSSPLLGIIGFSFLLAGILLGLFGTRLLRGR
ncbi:MAG: LysM peptidoglycan-binding domain-containing protein [Anaerolineales bacterium]|nr:LysM peptidoglycan-binding domain-containing protein [Anaerolineales bacterium]MDW8446186.1 LysM peptidoglycan-binding domain-containing protein [Anaerolineales bacterium]